MENAGVSRRPRKIWLIWKFSLKASCSQKSDRLPQGDLFPGKTGIAQLPSVFHRMIVALCMRAKGGGFGSANLCGAGTVGYQMIRGERVLFLMWPGQITAGHGDLWKRTSECESGGALTSEVYAGAVALLIYCNEEDIRGKASLLHSSSTINEPPPPPCLATPQYFLP